MKIRKQSLRLTMTGKSRVSPFLNISSETLLSSFNLQFLDVVLAERFLLPPESLKRFGEKVPTTVGELIQLSGVELSEVSRVFKDCLEINAQIESLKKTEDEWRQTEETLLVDMRPGLTIEDEPLVEGAFLFHQHPPAYALSYLAQFTHVVVFSKSKDHAWSAAMALRKMNIHAFLTNES